MANTTIIYDQDTFNEQLITCSNCGWVGTGADTIIIDMYGIGNARQVNCPNCDNNLGSLPKEAMPGNEPADDELGESIGQ